jgi:hypothetical protein
MYVSFGNAFLWTTIPAPPQDGHALGKRMGCKNVALRRLRECAFTVQPDSLDGRRCFDAQVRKCVSVCDPRGEHQRTKT